MYSDNGKGKGILCVTQDFAGAGITLHVAGPGMHVYVIERTVRTIKEGVRPAFKYEIGVRRSGRPCPPTNSHLAV